MDKRFVILPETFCFNKRGGMNKIIMDNLSYIILTIVFMGILFGFIYLQSNGAGVWQDFYSKEIVKVINLAEDGDEIWIDVHKGTKIARGNGINSKEIFSFEDNDVCVKLGRGRATCYSYFNDLDVVGSKIEPGVPINLLYIKVGERDE